MNMSAAQKKRDALAYASSLWGSAEGTAGLGDGVSSSPSSRSSAFAGLSIRYEPPSQRPRSIVLQRLLQKGQSGHSIGPWLSMALSQIGHVTFFIGCPPS